MIPLIPIALIALGVALLYSKGDEDDAPRKHDAGGIRGSRGREQRPDGPTSNGQGRVTNFGPKAKTKGSKNVSTRMGNSAMVGDGGDRAGDDSGRQSDRSGRDHHAGAVDDGDGETEGGGPPKSSQGKGGAAKKKEPAQGPAEKEVKQ